MAYTAPVIPSSSQPTGSAFVTSDHTDTHAVAHGRLISGSVENPRAHGALGNTDDDTVPFLKAINNLKARGGLGNGTLYVPAGWYVLDGNEIGAALTTIDGWQFAGDGPGSTIIQAKAGTSCAFMSIGAIQCHFRGITFYGRGSGDVEDGFVLKGNSQANLFENCYFGVAATGMNIVANGANDQADKNTFINCHTLSSAVGMHVNSGNAQQQVWIGGNHANNAVSVQVSLGWYHQIGGQVQHAGGVGTAYQLDTGAPKLVLDDVITEGEAISIDVQSMTSPAIIDLRHCTLQGMTKVIKGATGGVWVLDALGCNFNSGPIEAGIGSVFYDRHNVFGSGSVWTPNTSAIRYKYASDGIYTYIGSTTHTTFDSPSGWSDRKSIAAPASPAAGYLRDFVDSADGVLKVKDSAGALHALY